MTLQLIPESQDNPFRTGRHIHHDPVSLAYGVVALPYSSLNSMRWERRVPIFDQRNTASCTGNAGVGWMVTDNALRQGLTEISSVSLDEYYALGFYSDETKIDRLPGVYPPDDNGSTGLAAGKVLKARGFAKSYHHAFGLQSALSALQTTPVLLGVGWRRNMFVPSTVGQLDIRGPVVGGHEVLLDEIDVANKRVWLTNSWGSWALDGRAWLTWEDLAILLHDQGDVTVPLAAM